MPDFNKGLFNIERGKVVANEWALVTYSKDYKTQLAVFINRDNLKEIRDHIDSELKATAATAVSDSTGICCGVCEADSRGCTC